MRNRELKNATNLAYYYRNKESINARRRSRYIKEKDIKNEIRRREYKEDPEPHILASREYRKTHRDACIRAAVIAWRQRYNSDPAFRLEMDLRSKVRKILKVGSVRSTSTQDLIGCTKDELTIYVQSKFKPGMSWENHGDIWEIDHIKPCSLFNVLDPEQRKAYFHFTNLQPLFKHENWAKGSKYEEAA